MIELDAGHHCGAAGHLRGLGAARLRAVLETLSPTARAQCMQAGGLRLRSGTSLDQIARLLVARLRTLDGVAVHRIAVVLTDPLRAPLLQFVGDDEAALIDDFRAGVPQLLTRSSPPVVAMLIELLAEMGVYPADVRDRLIEVVGTAVPSGVPSETGAGGGAGTNAATPPAEGAPAERSGQPEGDEPAGSPLDELIAGCIRRASAGTSGPDRVAVAHGLVELLTLDGERPGSWRLVGIAEGLLVPVPETQVPPTAAAAHQRRVGRALAFALQGRLDALAALALEEPAETEAILRGPDSQQLAGPLLTGLLAVDLAMAARLLKHVAQPFAGWPAFVEQLERAAREQLDRDPLAAAALLRAADEVLTGWTPSLDPASQRLVERAAAQTAVGRVACQRRAGDFAGAGALASRIDTRLLTAERRGRLAEEVAMAMAELPCWQATPLASGASGRERARVRLERAERSIEMAVAAAPGGVAGRVMRAGLALARGDLRGAAVDLAVGYDALAASGDAAGPGVGGAAVRFHLGLARLCLLEPGTDEAARQHIEAALHEGHAATADELLLAAQAFDAHGSPAALRALRRALQTAPRDVEALALAAALARRLVPGAAGVAAERGRDEGLARRVRFDLLDAALTAALAHGEGEETEQLIDDLERLVARAADADLDRRWAGRLGGDDPLRAAFGEANVDLVRLHTLRRAGATDEAVAVARSAYHRALAGGAGDADPVDLLDLLDLLGAAREEVETLRRLLPRSIEAPRRSAPLARPVRLVFVGGDEMQIRVRAPVQRSLVERYGDLLTVDWFAPGWSANWAPDAGAIERLLPGAGALVLMPLVRTLLGRRLRRAAGQAGVPWVACTGHGRASIERAIDRSVTVVLDHDG